MHGFAWIALALTNTAKPAFAVLDKSVGDLSPVCEFPLQSQSEVLVTPDANHGLQLNTCVGHRAKKNRSLFGLGRRRARDRDRDRDRGCGCNASGVPCKCANGRGSNRPVESYMQARGSWVPVDVPSHTLHVGRSHAMAVQHMRCKVLR